MKTRIEAFFLWIYFFFGNHRKQWYDQMEIYHYAYSKQVEELDKLVQYTEGNNRSVRIAYKRVVELSGSYILLMTLLSKYPNSYSIAKQIIETTNRIEYVEKEYNEVLLSIDIK
jgi:hypothetical protein